MMTKRAYSNNLKLIQSATMIGSTHIKMGLPNQDCAKIFKSEKIQIITIADGVGSDKNAKKGSKCICDSVIKAFKLLNKKKVRDENLTKMIFKIYKRTLRPCERKNSATTNLFVGLLNDKLYVGQSGDGICCIKLDGKFRHTKIEHDFMNEVKAITGKNNNSSWKYKIINVKKIKEIKIMLLTDGISEDICPNKLEDFMEYVFERVDKEHDSKKVLMDILNQWNEFSNDDRTIAIARWGNASCR